MRWFKFYGQDFLTDPKLLSVDPLIKLVWVTLLSLCDHDTGQVKHLSEHSLLRLAGTDDDMYGDPSDYHRTKGCLKLFESLEMITLDNIDDNGEKNNDNIYNDFVITLVNFKKRQSQDSSAYERLKRHREKKKLEAKNKGKGKKDDNGDDNAHDNVIKSYHDNVRQDKTRQDKTRQENKRKHNIKAESKKASENESILEAPEALVKVVEEKKTLNALVEEFKNLDMNYERFFKNKTQRAALQRLVDKFGYDEIQRLLISLPQLMKEDNYCPQIASPLELEAKFTKLMDHLARAERKEEHAKSNSRIAYVGEPLT